MQYSIENIAGIDCIFAPMQESNSITITTMCRAGSVYESAELNGISHFLEHMFFKGGKKYPTPKAVAEAVDRFGGEFNASTGNEQVQYYVKCAPNFAEEALDVLADMMMHAQFPQEELEKEKGVVIQELKMYEDDPMSVAAEHWQERYLGNNSYGRPIIGSIDNILSFSPEKLHQYKQQLYTKDNLIIVIAGKILDKDSLQKQIEHHFSSLIAERSISKPSFDFYQPLEHEAFFDKQTEQNHLIISARGFNGKQEQRYPARVLSTILWGNMSSRLFQNVRAKQGLCYYISAGHAARTDFGDFIIRAGIDKERFEFWVAKIFEEIEQIATGDILVEEFHNAIGFLDGQIQMGIESSDEMAGFLGRQYLSYGTIETLQEILEKYHAVSLQDVKEIASLLRRDNLYLYYVK